MSGPNKYYVYVYIDPRTLAPFYYGKGQGSRKYAHLQDDEISEKGKIIHSIKREGLNPIIKIIASNLSEPEAHLIETTLIWTLGKQITNVAGGYYTSKFRPPHSFHKDLSGFDYETGLYYYNVGEGPHRHWDDYRQHGYIAAGQGVRWRDAIRNFNVGDVFAAYLKRYGYVGIGRIKETAKPAREIIIKGTRLVDLPLKTLKMHDNINNDDLCEYVAIVEWIASVARKDAKKETGLYTTTHVRASLDNQPKTIDYLSKAFDINLRDLVL